MAYVWESGYTHNTLAGDDHQEIQLGFLGTAERLRRVVVQSYMEVVTSDASNLQNWMRYGVLSLVQVTQGSPPPTPQEVGAADWNNRDILDSQFYSVGSNYNFNNRWRLPPEPDMIKHDTAVSRGDGVEPIAVWWCWGLPTFTGAGSSIGYARTWWRVLREL